MAECCDDQDHRYRHRLPTYRPSSSRRPDDEYDDDEDQSPPVVVPTSSAAAAAAAHLFGGSFQFIVQEQAKSMVAIQELQQEVGSLLLFRQAVLAALPHLQPSTTATTTTTTATTNSVAGLKGVRSGQSWTRRKQQLQQLAGYRSLQDGDQPPAVAGNTSTNNNNNPSGGVVDSGFSTEASNSNSNTSPRSSRFDTNSSTGTSAELPTMPHPPMEKELIQHLERVQQRLARLKKDEDRLLTLLNPNPAAKRMMLTTAMSTMSTAGSQEDGRTDNDDHPDELWLLLEEIQMRSQAIRTGNHVKDDNNMKPEETVQPMSHKKRVSFQQQQQQQQLDTESRNAARTSTTTVVAGKGTTRRTSVAAAKAVLPSPPVESTSRYQPPTRDQVAAILRLTNPVQLQRHLLRALLDNQSLREQVEAGRTELDSRDAQWRTNSQLAVEQMTALRDENEDLRFQLEEQKIELEGTKARLRMLSRTPTPPTPLRTPALTSIRVRAASTQTDRPTTTTTVLALNKIPAKIHSQSTQTEPEDNNNKSSRPLPRVVDASPKPKLSKLVDLTSSAGRGSGSWAADEEDRPSVERRSYSSRIPTPIKPTVIPVVTPVNNNNINKMQQQQQQQQIVTPSKRELPDIPSSTGKSKAALLTPQLGKNHLRGGFVGSKSDPAKVRVTVVTAGSSPHQRVRTRLSLADSLSSSEDQHATHPHADGSKVDDYYDSINANHNSNSGNNLRINKNQSPYPQRALDQSPLDSLERSLPSADIQFPFRRIVQTPQPNGSYNSQSSADNSSTTPSNSLSLQP